MAFCGRCGQKLEEGDLFCPSCGNKILKKDDVINKSNNVDQRNTFVSNERRQPNPINQQQVNHQSKDSFNNLKNQTLKQIQESKPITISFDREFEKSTLTALISSVVIAISTLLPCVGVSTSALSFSINISLMDLSKYISYIEASAKTATSSKFISGLMLAILAIVTVVGILMKNDKLELITGALTGAFGLYEAYTISQALSISDNFTKGSGFYLMMLCSIILLFAVGIDFLNSKYNLNKQ